MRFAVFYYGLMDSTSGARADLPLLIVKAGRDSVLRVNQTIDAFMDWSKKENLPVELRLYERGRHGFDVDDSAPEAVAVVRESLKFMVDRLARP